MKGQAQCGRARSTSEPSLPSSLTSTSGRVEPGYARFTKSWREKLTGAQLRVLTVETGNPSAADNRCHYPLDSDYNVVVDYEGSQGGYTPTLVQRVRACIRRYRPPCVVTRVS